MRALSLFKLVFLLALLGLAAAFMAYRHLENYWFQQTLNFDDAVVIDVVSGDTTSAAMTKLFAGREGEHAAALRKVAMRLFERDSTIKVGEYSLSGQYTRDAALSVLQSGEALQRRVTFIDGHTLKQTYTAVSQPDSDFAKDFEGFEHLQIALRGGLSAEAVSMMDGKVALEGWYYPDTYFYTKGTALEKVFARAHQKMIDSLQREWAGRQPDLPLASPYEALILASIVERESGHVDERKEIAGVFIRRLRLGMRLQTDPTVIYGMGEKYQGNIRRSDLRRDTPYNTYTRDGLPPTPIANPGVESIHAVLHPAKGKALYFVAKGDGSHAFSETLEEHNKAVRRYQILQRRADYRSAPK